MKPLNTIGFIGAGNMGSAIIGGMIGSQSFDAKSINVCDKVISDTVHAYGVNKLSLKETCEGSDCIVLAVKPAGLGEVLNEVKNFKDYDKKLYISIAAGYKLESIKNQKYDYLKLRLEV